MEWLHKSFHELHQMEIYALFKARVDVFVVEQQCAYPEVDEFDLQATHIWLHDNQKMVAYARILPANSKYQEVSIGRVLVTNNYRGKGYGKQLMKQAIHYAANHFKSNIKIQAQQYLSAFYESFGFKQISPAYLEDGIWHIDMIWDKMDYKR
ncbi:GNAT family acetyltransferase [Virgibacillus pantothenticus]|uniref:GNAT family N-acetyltransferase n=1 Tax=Virgibacillus TaxID=84406 RepID=UPI00090A940B|nr:MULTISPECIES: GNAT family N-acetyltransferase [Virgibacillus]API91708.1 GNAT family N-acetyltransferase [Virgibacillus sp. 6R]MBS7427822.1 GNAT family N-acetyltransferase [Virgibacillus sp. 19R1-5]GIP65515.1 GNAT family acetyltransferase [Virgibacillus pantothenticus]